MVSHKSLKTFLYSLLENGKYAQKLFHRVFFYPDLLLLRWQCVSGSLSCWKTKLLPIKHFADGIA